MRFLLFVTTHFPAYHQSFLETCWPPATRKSALLQQADVLVFATGAVSDQNRAAVATAFDACKSTRVVAVRNPGKGKGAMLPLQMAEREGWWSGYDWVIRLNPDVIIRSDAHLLPLFARSDVDAVFASCPTRMAPALRLRVHTDFAAWRPEKIQKGAFAIHPQVSEAFCGVGGRRYTSSICNPERAATRSFQSILRSGRYALLPNPDKKDGCRIGGPQSAIVHQHGYVAHCVRDLARNASYDAPRLASVG